MLADHYEGVQSAELRASTPKEVSTVFERARNAFLYAWFSHELTTWRSGRPVLR